LATSWPIAGKIRYGSPVYAKRPRPWDPASGRPSDDQLMDLLRARLLEIAPSVAAGSHVDDGVLEGRGWSWTALPNHTGRPTHFDVGFSVGGPVIADCISGTGSLTEAVDQFRYVWSATSAACFLELVEPGSSTARRLPGTDPAGIPGRETIVSAVIGYGPDAPALQQALAERAVLRDLPLDLATDRPNGIKIYLYRTPGETTGEVRVNGALDATASHRLAAMDWPEVGAPVRARFYAVTVPPAADRETPRVGREDPVGQG
jgi:hypothetical protein